MGSGPGVMQREILRRASARRNAFTVREMASKLFTSIDDTRLGAVRRAMHGLVVMGYLRQDGRTYRRTSKPLASRPEWTTPLEIVPIDWASANAMLSDHYLGAARYQPMFCLTTPTRDALALFGPPIASHFKIVLPAPLELVRLWRGDDCPFPLSQFLALTLRWLRREVPSCSCVFSYADPAATNPVNGQAHHGGIYAASNFVLLGSARATDHWLDDDGSRVSAAQCYRRFATKSAARIAEIAPTWRHVAGVKKLLYAYPLALSVADVLDRVGPGSRYNRTDLIT